MSEKLTQFDFDGNALVVDYVETQTVKDGVECDVYTFRGNSEQDLAIVRVKAGFSTPLQNILKGDRTIEGHISGEARLTVTIPDGSENQHSYFDLASYDPVAVTVGSLMQWTAITDLTFYEVCSPPYKDGRFQNIDEN